MKIKELFLKINNFLEGYSKIIANLIINLIAVVLMLMPGIIFALFLFNLITFFMGRELIMRWIEFLKLVPLALICWYLGIGFYKHK